MAKKKKLLLIVGVVLLLGGGGAGAYFGGLLGGDKDKKAEKEEHAAKEDEHKADPHQYVFYELPDILVNLNNNGKRNSFLKIKINLELEDPAYVKTVEAVMPRIIDNLQVYLRELRTEDLQGSEGLYRLREELLHRINTAANPARVNDVLFAEMLMQ